MCHGQNSAQYRDIIKQTLTQYADLVAKQAEPKIETLVAFDDAHNQFLWLQVGWDKRHRVYGTTLHVRLQNDKIWIEQDWTEDGIATDLLRAGVPREDIVLGFHP